MYIVQNVHCTKSAVMLYTFQIQLNKVHFYKSKRSETQRSLNNCIIENGKNNKLILLVLSSIFILVTVSTALSCLRTFTGFKGP